MSVSKSKHVSLKSQGAWLLFAKLVGFGFAFFLPMFVTRIFSEAEVGLYQQSFLIVMNAVAILPLGFAMSAYYYLSRDVEKRSSTIANILLVNFILGASAFFVLYSFPHIVGDFFKSDEMTKLAPAIGVAIWIWLFSTFLETVAVANREPKIAAAFIVFAQFSKASIMIAAILIFGSVEAIIYAAIVQGIVQTCVLLVYLSLRFPRFWTQFDFKFLREQIAYSIPFGLAGVLWIAQTDVHYYFVGNKFSDAEFAIYKFGCFQLPLLIMLAESVTSVMIPRMSELELKNDKKEMFRVIVRATEKLAFFFFPAYVFLLITAETFITTLFTRKFSASVSIFVIFLTLLPFHIWISDPIVRAYKELGKFLLILRIGTFVILLGSLYFGIESLTLQGIITIVVVVRIVEILIIELVVFRKIGVGIRDFPSLKNVLKTGLASIIAGIGTYGVYINIKGLFQKMGEHLIFMVLGEMKINYVDFVSGSMILGVSGLVFAIVYLIFSHLLGLIDEDEKALVRSIVAKLWVFAEKKKG